jgi:hypothetical protein
MKMLKKVHSYSVEIVMVLLLGTLGLVGYNTYKIQQLSGDVESARHSADYASDKIGDLYERPSNPNSDTLDDIQKTLDTMQDKLDSMDSDIFDIKHGLR